jgi:phosphoglycolate phosphatase-like HAD superfamily hydrolase
VIAAHTVIVDVDGTLVDSAYHHALAWQQALKRHGIAVPMWSLHRHVGMGGDQFVQAVAGEEIEGRLGDEIRADHDALFMSAFIDDVTALPGAQAFLEALAEDGRAVVLASSAKEAEVARYLDLLGARAVVDDWTTSADVEATKPDPALVNVALGGADPGSAVMIGDTTWDCLAAGRVGVSTVAVLTGGFGADELRVAGAKAVVESVEHLLHDRAVLDGVVPRSPVEVSDV